VHGSATLGASHYDRQESTGSRPIYTGARLPQMNTAPSASVSAGDSDPGVIRLRVRDLRQLFDTLDPAPFLERDLDGRMAEYVESSAAEIPGHLPLRLVVHLPGSLIEAGHPEMVQTAVHRHYQHQTDLVRRRFRRMLREGRRSLWIGLLVLAACMLIADLASVSEWRTVRVLGEGLVIGGWVAMWRPIEILLYDWWPLRREVADRERLRDIQVELQAEAA
jgi:hypothetical protein